MVSIYIAAFKQLNLLEFYFEKLQKHCKDEYTLNIINNGRTPELKTQIKIFCEKNNINCIPYEQVHTGDAAASLAQAFEFVQKNYIKNDKSDYIVFMDQDIFAYKDFSFVSILDGHDIAGIYQYRQHNEEIHEYFVSIFMILKNFETLHTYSWHTGVGDVGSWTNKLIKEDKSIKMIPHTAAIDIEKDFIFVEKEPTTEKYDPGFRSQFIDNCFYHYYRGSMWAESNDDYHERKWKFTKYLFDNINKYNINLDECVWYDKAHAQKGHNGVDHLYRGYKFTKRFPETKLYVEGQD